MAEHLTPAEQLSFVAGMSIAAAQDFARRRDQAALAEQVFKIMDEAGRLPAGTTGLELCAPVSLMTQALMLASKADDAVIHDWLAILDRLVQLINKANAKQREGATS